MTNQVVTYSRENGGRVIILFLLFFLALYQLITVGFPAFAIICILPFIVLFGYWTFKYGMFAFWALIVVNYFIQFQNLPPLPIPTSLPNEMLQLLLLGIAIIDARQTPHFERCANIMLLTILIWCFYCTMEILNDTCGLGINIGAWYQGARMMAFQLLYIFLVFSIYISSPETLMRYLKIWAILALFSAIWTWKQQNIGLTAAETSFLHGRGSTTHLIQGGTLIRYWSTFSDAANYGCNAAASAIAFLIFGITTKIKKNKWFFIIIALLVVKSMFASGTRTAIFCIAGGFAVFIVLSKNFKIAIPAVPCPDQMQYFAYAKTAAHLAFADGNLIGSSEMVLLRLPRHTVAEGRARHGLNGIVVTPLAVQFIETMRGEAGVFPEGNVTLGFQERNQGVALAHALAKILLRAFADGEMETLRN